MTNTSDNFDLITGAETSAGGRVFHCYRPRFEANIVEIVGDDGYENLGWECEIMYYENGDEIDGGFLRFGTLEDAQQWIINIDTEINQTN